MSKLKYLFKRILKMNYKKFFDTINLVHKRSKKNRLLIFFDIIICGFKYQAGYMDYNLFEMYNMNSKERKTIITRGIIIVLLKSIMINLKFINLKIKLNSISYLLNI